MIEPTFIEVIFYELFSNKKYYKEFHNYLLNENEVFIKDYRILQGALNG